MPKRPANYREWRALSHSEQRALGVHVYLCITNGWPIHDRTTYGLVSRLQRIEQQMEAEKDAVTMSYVECFYEWLMNK